MTKKSEGHSMLDCTRHAFTDGQCATYGCKDCPETLYAAELGTRTAAKINDDIKRAARRCTSLMTLALCWTAIVLTVGAGAAVIAHQGAKNWHAVNISNERV